jgi:biotin operon repressor
MSIDAINWAYRSFKSLSIPGSERLVLITICHRHHHKTNDCYPSYETISDACGLSRRQVMRSVKNLEEWGFIKIEKRSIKGRQTSNQYVLFGAPKAKAKPRRGVTLTPPHDGDRVSPLRSDRVSPNRYITTTIGESACRNIVKFPDQKSEGGDV